MTRKSTIYLPPEVDKRLARRYFLIINGANVAYLEDEPFAYYLDKKTGTWVEDAFTWRHISGIGGDSDCEEISEQDAKDWVTERLPDLKVDWS